MSYKTQFENIDNIVQLFDFREQLLGDAEKHSSLWYSEGAPARSPNLDKCQNANFYHRLVVDRINTLVRKGYSLDKIPNIVPVAEPSQIKEAAANN